jgi:hypothetical protein
MICPNNRLLTVKRRKFPVVVVTVTITSIECACPICPTLFESEQPQYELNSMRIEIVETDLSGLRFLFFGSQFDSCTGMYGICRRSSTPIAMLGELCLTDT